MRIEVNDTNFQVLEQGTGEPALVFLHYFGGSSRTWSEVIAGLSSTHRCIAPDLRGFGDSDATASGYSVGENADDVAALIQAVHIERYALIGHSMGGKIALALAARRPIGLQSLVLIAPSPPSPEPMAEQDRARLQSAFGQREGAEETLREITAHPLPPALFERALEDNLKSSLPAWQAWLEAGRREDITAQMPRINVPVCVVAGAQDNAMTPDVLRREVVERLAHAQLHIVPEAAHLLPLEAPATITRLIHDALISV